MMRKLLVPVLVMLEYTSVHLQHYTCQLHTPAAFKVGGGVANLNQGRPIVLVLTKCSEENLVDIC